ncbi:MAG: hypothetical protein MI976_11295 [Pseudomonadales bacterium]|nr:hypothetical protein [Pseudomonadales bacterium]
MLLSKMLWKNTKIVVNVMNHLMRGFSRRTPDDITNEAIADFNAGGINKKHR